MTANPFKPTAGKMPPILIGRRSVIEDFEEGLDNGAGAPGRLMLVSGQRGFGKTVMLTELGRVAKAKGWQVVSDTASEGLCSRLVAALTSKVKVSGASFSPSIGVGGIANASLGSISFAPNGDGALTLRKAIEDRLAKMDDGKGILFTIDEAQAASREEMVALATALQHVIRDEDMRDVPDSRKHGVAFVFAALPQLTDELLNDKVLTFLRRSRQHYLGAVPLADVRGAFEQTVAESGKRIAPDLALEAARATEGYPYMIQLVGYYMWQSAKRRGSDQIDEKDVRAGIEDAGISFEDAVCAPLYDGLTGAQRAFVEAMAVDWPEPTATTDIAQRTGKSASWVSKYRASLIKDQVIAADGKGMVKFATPHLATYVRRARP